MQSDGDRWDPATVIGLKNTDHVLVVGNANFMPWLTDVCHDVKSVRKISELKRYADNRSVWDKVIIARETTFVADLVKMIAPLLDHRNNGMFISFPSDDGWSIEQAMNFYHPNAQVTLINSTFGAVFMADLRDAGWR